MKITRRQLLRLIKEHTDDGSSSDDPIKEFIRSGNIMSLRQAYQLADMSGYDFEATVRGMVELIIEKQEVYNELSEMIWKLETYVRQGMKMNTQENIDVYQIKDDNLENELDMLMHNSIQMQVMSMMTDHMVKVIIAIAQGK